MSYLYSNYRNCFFLVASLKFYLTLLFDIFHRLEQRINVYPNDPKFSDRQELANSANQDQICTFCRFLCGKTSVLEYYCITATFLCVIKFRTFMVQNLHQCHSSNPSSLMPTQNQLGEPGHGASDSLPGPSSVRGTKQQNRNSKTGI